jgi:ribosomal-protein-alanine N-acetyltransferase
VPDHYATIIETVRLRLRPFRQEDWAAVHEYATDPEISRFQDWGPNSEQDTRSFVAKCIESSGNPKSRSYYFSINLLGDDQHIGGCVLTLDPHSIKRASVGYTIARPYWKLGYATEAASELLKYGFTVLSLRSITGSCDASNVASRRVMEKAGMRLSQTERNAKFFKGRWRDFLEYEITYDAWRLEHENRQKA